MTRDQTFEIAHKGLSEQLHYMIKDIKQLRKENERLKNALIDIDARHILWDKIGKENERYKKALKKIKDSLYREKYLVSYDEVDDPAYLHIRINEIIQEALNG